MALKEKFKWYAGAVKVAAQNLGDNIATGQKAQGAAMAGVLFDQKSEMEALDARIKARKAARKASKPA